MRKEFTEKMATDFLWSTYFGITKTDAELNKRKAAYCCADRAYRDLCRRISFAYSSSEIEEMKKEEREEYIQKKQEFRYCVSEYIVESILNLKSDFDGFHKAICSGIISFSNGNNSCKKRFNEIFNEPLNYGLAQKWLNMTIKNMIVMGLWNNILDNYLPYLHIPLDSYIFDAASGEEGEPICEGENVKHLGINEKEYFKNYTWSNIPNNNAFIEKYYQYQKRIKEKTNCNQIEWEHKAWIAESKKNRK